MLCNTANIISPNKCYKIESERFSFFLVDTPLFWGGVRYLAVLVSSSMRLVCKKQRCFPAFVFVCQFYSVVILICWVVVYYLRFE